jgi:predicted ferric reductase
MRPGLVRLCWAATFLAVLLGPTLLSLVNGNDNPLVSQLAVQTGLLATGLLVGAVVAPSRLRSLTRALGIEGVLGTHRSLGLLVALMVLLHLMLVLVANPGAVTLFDPRQATTASRAAVIATVSLVVLVGLAVLRGRVRRRYALWRWVHILLGVTSVVATGVHIWWLGHLVADPVLRVALTVIAVGLLGVLGVRWLWRPMLDKRGAYVVRAIRAETDDVHTLVIGPRRPRHGFDVSTLAFEPGQFAWIRVRRSVLAEEHPFTIASCAAGSESVEFTIRDVGDFTSSIGSLGVGDPVWIDGPHGAFTWDNRMYSRALVLVAAGVGITPMISMLRTMAFRGDATPVLLLCAARTEDGLLFRDELGELAARLNLTVVQVLSNPRSDWAGRSGRIDKELLDDVLPQRTGRRKFEYFLCGPPAMVAGAGAALAQRGIDPARIHTEQFDMV